MPEVLRPQELAQDLVDSSTSKLYATTRRFNNSESKWPRTHN